MLNLSGDISTSNLYDSYTTVQSVICAALLKLDCVSEKNDKSVFLLPEPVQVIAPNETPPPVLTVETVLCRAECQVKYMLTLSLLCRRAVTHAEDSLSFSPHVSVINVGMLQLVWQKSKDGLVLLLTAQEVYAFFKEDVWFGTLKTEMPVSLAHNYMLILIFYRTDLFLSAVTSLKFSLGYWLQCRFLVISFYFLCLSPSGRLYIYAAQTSHCLQC